jgi:dephospho-CoA kinase
MNKIIAIVGMCGSGKSVATEVFKERGYNNIYFGDVTFDEMKRLNMPVTPENERYMREKIREDANGDKGIYAKMLIPKITEAYKVGKVSIESMYSWSEYKYLRQAFGENFKVLCIATNRQVRYDRLSQREFRPLTFEQAENRDITEIENIEKAGPIAFADYYVTNNGDVKELVKKVGEFIDNIEK